MGSNDLSLKVILSAQDKASGVLRGFGSTLVNLAGAKGPLLSAMLGISAAAVGIGVAAVSSAADFQQAMLSNVAHAGLAKSQFDAVSNAVLNMAGEVGRSPTQLAEALYPILSAFSGIQNQSAKSSLALSTLKLSFEAVAGTTVNGTSVANAAVGTFNALGLATNNAALNAKRMANLFDIMDLNVQQGNMTWDAYKNVISKLAVSISGTSVKFNEAAAALATLTNEGMSAQKAQTYLSNMFTTMAIKTDAMAAHAKKLHIAFNENAYSSMNLADKIKYLNQITDGNKQKLLALLGGNATALKAFNALSVGVSNYKTNLQGLNHAHGALKSSFDTAAQGFNFAMSKAKAAIEALLIKIGTGLLPILTKLVGAVAPAVNWLINFASAVSKNEVAMAAIKGFLVGFVVVLGALLIPAFYAWAVAAGAAALATLAATWPILLIGAIVAAVVAGIILAVQHWGQIVAWLKGVWGAIVGFFQGLWNKILQGLGAVGQFFKNLWHGITTGVGNFFNLIGTTVHNGLMQLVNMFLSPFTGIINMFKWLYNHNYYFKNLIDTIKKIVTGGLKWLQDQWNRFTGWLGGLWSGLKDKAGQAWGAVSNAIGPKVSGATSWLKNAWTTSGNWLAEKWNGLKDDMGKAWAAVSGVISGAWNTYVAKPLQNLWNSFLNFVNGWPKQAVQWGINLIQGLINGITSMLGNIGKTVGNVGNTIKNFLGFHSPTKEGPGRESDTWAPNLVKMFSAGLMAGKPAIQAALNAMVSPMLMLNHPPAQSGSVPYGRPPISSNYSNYAGGGNHYGNNSIVIQGAGQSPDAIASTVMQKLSQQYRRSGVMGNAAYGIRSS